MKSETLKIAAQLSTKLPTLNDEARAAGECLVLSLKALALNAPDPGPVLRAFVKSAYDKFVELLSRS